MEGIGRRNIEEIALSVVVNIARVDDCAFKEKWVTQAVRAAKKLDESFMQPLNLLDGQKARFAH